MKGTLYKTKQGWVVSRCVGDGVAEVWEERLPLHPDDESLWMFAELNEEWKDKLDGKEVDFEIVDEFTHPELYTNVGWGDGIKYAKLIPSKEQQKELITEIMDLDAKDGLYEDTSHRDNPRTDDIDKFEQDAWDNYEHVEGNLYSTTFRNAFKLGYKKAQETLYTEEQVREAMSMARKLSGIAYTNDEIIQSLKQPKKD
jgi:hypothetical protein